MKKKAKAKKNKKASQANPNETRRKHGMKKEGEYFAFAEFIALPRALRESVLGVKTQTDFAKRFGVNEWTLVEWKKREEFQESVKKIRASFFRERTGDVLLSVETNAIKTGDAAPARLLLEVTGEVKKEKSDDPNHLPEVLAEAIRNLSSILK